MSVDPKLNLSEVEKLPRILRNNGIYEYEEVIRFGLTFISTIKNYFVVAEVEKIILGKATLYFYSACTYLYVSVCSALQAAFLGYNRVEPQLLYTAIV